MANTIIKLKTATTANSVPTSLATGELALDHYNGLLWFKTANGIISTIKTSSDNTGNTGFTSMDTTGGNYGTVAAGPSSNSVVFSSGNDIIIDGFYSNNTIRISSPNVAVALASISVVSNTANDAQATANTAQEIAENAQGTAENAQGTADNAQTTADNAQATAYNARTIANTAFNKANTIVGIAPRKQQMWIPAMFFMPRMTAGPEYTTTVMPNGIGYITLNFDPAALETAEASIRMPKSWNKGTITFQTVIAKSSTQTGSVVWNIAAAAISTGDPFSATVGTEVSVTVTPTTANLAYISTESANVTIAGVPVDGDIILIQLRRSVFNSSDTLAIDAKLHGINIYYTANTSTDA